jgi:formylmethanofuran dehydrogenase subunit E
MQSLELLLRKSSISHTHLCPRQILGVRIGLAGMNALGLSETPGKKGLLIISETDGCFVDGLTAVTACTVGHRTLRVEDYGKIAATFVDVKTCLAVRVAPQPDIRERAYAYAPGELRRYFAQMRAYQMMPNDELLLVQEVVLSTHIRQIISRPGIRVTCDSCGEEIINNREILRDGLTLCRACNGDSYFQPSVRSPAQHTEFLIV